MLIVLIGGEKISISVTKIVSEHPDDETPESCTL